MRILNVADFNWMTGAERHSARLSLFDICRKFSLAATRANHLVVEFSDRAVARSRAPLRLRGLGEGWANRRFLQCVDELRPDLILLHFADRISNQTLTEARNLAPGILIADVNIDPIDTPKNQTRLGFRTGFVDALFVTTAEPDLGRYAGRGAFAAFLPNPVDSSVETGRAFETAAPAFDLLFPAHDDRPREVGAQHLSPSQAVARLCADLPGLKLSCPGVGRSARGWRIRLLPRPDVGADGLVAVPPRQPAPLRLRSHGPHVRLGAWPCCSIAEPGSTGSTVTTRRRSTTVFDGLIAHVRRLMADDEAARALAQRGWEKTWSLFESGRVLAYVLAQLQDERGARDYEWPCERWG